MLLKKSELVAIKSGELSLVFRRWRRPTVKSGGSLKTAVGVLGIVRVDRVERSRITARDAAAAGHGSLTELLNKLDSREGDYYRIEVRFAGEDPRTRLRERDQLSESELLAVRASLTRLDAASKIGKWTGKVLRAIQKHPHVAAATLAAHTGFEKEWLKLHVRKLKNLGLTISHEPGYELSPRGRAVLMHMKGDV